MWAWPGLLLALALLHVGGAESEGGALRCQAPPTWKIGEVEPMKEALGKVTVVALLQASWLFCLVQAGRMDGLRQKLETQGLQDIVYMVINHQGEQAQNLHPLLANKLSANITLYKQPENQPDVWQLLNGEKDDFLIYDRCGRLTVQISLPQSIIGAGHVERAIREAYCARSCGECTYETQSTETPEECRARPTEAASIDPQPAPHHPHHGHHGHHHHHHHGHHDALGRHDGHEHHHGNQQQGQAELDLMQQVQVDTQTVMLRRPWAVEKAKWKSKHSWQWAAGSENEAAPKASWCWHWRRAFGEAGVAGAEPVGQWRCEEALPASWQWRGLTGGHVEAVTETWQWRAPPADWPQPRPAAPWAWPPNVQSWDWQHM